MTTLYAVLEWGRAHNLFFILMVAACVIGVITGWSCVLQWRYSGRTYYQAQHAASQPREDQS